MQKFSQKFRRITLIFDNQAYLNELLLERSNTKNKCFVSDNELLFIDPLSKKLNKNLSNYQISNKRVNQYLGQELELVIYDATQSFDVNAFTAICGCIIGGGEIFLLLPKTLETVTQTTIKPSQKSELSQTKMSPTLVRLVNELINLPETRWFSENQQSDNYGFVQANETLIDNLQNFRKEQKQLIDRILRCSLGHAKRPVIIMANRGRGKSASIGIAIAELVYKHQKSIIITSPRKENIKILLKHFNSEIERLSNSSDEYKKHQQLIIFSPPDKIITDKPECDLLIIEEAGAIPVQTLKTFTADYNRIVFSTTTDGYEGNGQGFKLRFKSHLINNFPQARFENLKYPARWPIDDPLETAINRAFLLSFDKPHKLNDNLELELELEYDSANDKKKIEFRQITKTIIKTDNSLLSDIYQLLVTAHYQTRPSDLERILADEDLIIFSAFLNQKVIATSLIVKEGNLSTDECDRIEKGQLRTSGHLLPQSLMTYQGLEKAGKLSFWRVMRIAVTPKLQKQSIGSQLISHVEKQAITNSVDIIGSSFSFDQDIGRFWYKQEFQCSRIALRKDSSTGNHPCEFLKLLEQKNELAQSIYSQSITYFNQSFSYSIGSAYREIATPVILLIAKNQNALFYDENFHYRTQEIKRYCNKHRSFEMIEWELYNFLNLELKEKITIFSLSIQEQLILIAKILQQCSWQKIVRQFDLKGKNQAKEIVRNSILELLNGRMKKG